MNNTKLVIFYGFHQTPFGESIIALSEKGVCYISFIEDADYLAAINDLEEVWPYALLKEDAARTSPIAHYLVNPQMTQQACNIHLKGSDFQIAVWDALLDIPRGTTVSYTEIAHHIGKPKAVRAVASAIAKNNIALLIPCHRVISKSGNIGDYRWGKARKQAILTWESQKLQ